MGEYYIQTFNCFDVPSYATFSNAHFSSFEGLLCDSKSVLYNLIGFPKKKKTQNSIYTFP